MKYLTLAWELLKGKKSYIVAAVAVLYGWLYNDKDAILVGLAAFGLRNAITTEVTRLITFRKK